MNIHVIIAPLLSEIFFTFAKNHFKIIREEDWNIERIEVNDKCACFATINIDLSRIDYIVY